MSWKSKIKKKEKKKEYTHTGYFNEKSKQNIRRI